MRARPLIAVTTSELRRPEDVVARPEGEPPKLEVALATLYPEAIEQAGERMDMGVQWHAEGLHAHGPLFDLLIDAAVGGAQEPRRLATTRRGTRSRRAGDSQPRLARAAG